MSFTRERYAIQGSIRLHEREFIVGTRLLRHDDRKIPLYDLYELPMIIGRFSCSHERFQRIVRAREEQLERATEALTGGAVSMISNIQRLLKKHLEPMLYLTDNDVLNTGNTTVIMRAHIRPDQMFTDMAPWEAYPVFPYRLSRFVFFRPRIGWHGVGVPVFAPANDGDIKLEVTGYQTGRYGLPENGLRTLRFPTVKPSRVQRVLLYAS